MDIQDGNNLNTRTYVAIFLIVASIGIATVSFAPVFADKSSGQQGVDKADDAIHASPGFDKADPGFHKGTCSGGFGAGGYSC